MDIAPYHQEILNEVNAQAVHPVILHVLGMRFGPVPKDVADVVRVTKGESALDDILRQVCSCPDLAAFRSHLGL